MPLIVPKLPNTYIWAPVRTRQEVSRSRRYVYRPSFPFVMSKKRVAYFHDSTFCTCDSCYRKLKDFLDDVGVFTYGTGHQMKPQRMRITHELIAAYGMLDKMHVLVRNKHFASTTLSSTGNNRDQSAPLRRRWPPFTLMNTFTF